MKKNRIVSIVVAIAFLPFALTIPAIADKKAAVAKEGIEETADWHKDPECQAVFFTVLEGLYRDGVPQEVVDLVIGHVETNKLEKSFVFRCKLCHACYEAFALYQRRPNFTGTKGKNTIGNKEIPKSVMEGLKSTIPQEFDPAFASIVQPWIKADLERRLALGEDGLELMKKYVQLAKDGNALRETYTRCQACDAISDIAKAMQQGSSKKAE